MTKQRPGQSGTAGEPAPAEKWDPGLVATGYGEGLEERAAAGLRFRRSALWRSQIKGNVSNKDHACA